MTKELKIIAFFKEFQIILFVSVILILYSSLQSFGIFPENFPSLELTIKDILSGTLTLIGLIIAFEGLSTWKKQFTLTQKNRLASEILDKVHSFVSYVYKIRMPIMSTRISSQDILGDLYIKIEEKEKYFNSNHEIFHKYREILSDMAWRLEKYAIEAKIVLGKDISDPIADLVDITINIFVSYTNIFGYFKYKEENKTIFKEEQFDEYWKTLFIDFLSIEDDEISDQLEKSLELITTEIEGDLIIEN